MGIFRIIKHIPPPTTLTISVTILCEPFAPPKFVKLSENRHKNGSRRDSIEKDNEPKQKKKRVIVKKKMKLSQTPETSDILKLQNVTGNGKSKEGSVDKTKKESVARYRVIEFQESTINITVEMEKQNVGNFVWDQQCTRIDALIEPVPELDRSTTPEIPISVGILP